MKVYSYTFLLLLSGKHFHEKTPFTSIYWENQLEMAVFNSYVKLPQGKWEEDWKPSAQNHTKLLGEDTYSG